MIFDLTLSSDEEQDEQPEERASQVSPPAPVSRARGRQHSKSTTSCRSSKTEEIIDLTGEGSRNTLGPSSAGPRIHKSSPPKGIKRFLNPYRKDNNSGYSSSIPCDSSGNGSYKPVHQIPTHLPSAAVAAKEIKRKTDTTKRSTLDDKKDIEASPPKQ